ncbi:glycosyltransferase [Marinomonas gallaica]|uniref:glycosyltransferase n=1 Tax=Marinomonas gallaica TaxID=1806667 RepID=UPI003CE44950
MTAMLPKVAVLLAAYQGIRWIAEQVDSILSQRNVSVTLFISVDACPENSVDDGTLAWCQNLASIRKNVHLLPYGERFGGAGANFFRLLKDVNFSAFDAISLADQDDVWLPTKLEYACECIRDGLCQVYSSNVTAFWPDGHQQLIKKSYPQRRYDHFFEAAGPGCTYVLDQSVAQSLQIFLCEQREYLSKVALHDWLIYAYCRQQGVAWYIDDQSTMHYRQHAGNQVGVNQGITAYKKRLKQVASKYYRGQVELISRLVAPELMPKLQSFWFRLTNVLQCRRRSRDRFALLVMFLLCIY